MKTYTLTTKGKSWDYTLKEILRAIVSILTTLQEGETITITVKGK